MYRVLRSVWNDAYGRSILVRVRFLSICLRYFGQPVTIVWQFVICTSALARWHPADYVCSNKGRERVDCIITKGIVIWRIRKWYPSRWILRQLVNLGKSTFVTGILSPDYSSLQIHNDGYFNKKFIRNMMSDILQFRFTIFGAIKSLGGDPVAKGWKIHSAGATIASPSAYGNSRYRIRRSNFHRRGREREEDVYVGKAGSCERICTRISPASRAAGRIGYSVDSSASSTKGGGGGLDKGRRRDLLRPPWRGEEWRERARIKRGREMARMPHYACTPGGRVREWVTDWRTSSSRIHLRASTCARTRLFCRVLGARIPRTGVRLYRTVCIVAAPRRRFSFSRGAEGWEREFRLEGTGKIWRRKRRNATTGIWS